MFMTSKEVHFKDFSFSSTTQELELSWRVEEDLIPYKCDLVQVEIGIKVKVLNPCLRKPLVA